MPVSFYALWALALSVYILSGIIKSLIRYFKLRSIPSARHVSFFGSYIETLNFIKNGRDILQWGYDKYPNGAFKVPEIGRWHVVVNGKEMMDDMKRARDDELSVGKAVDKGFHIEYNFGKHFHDSMYHAGAVRGPLTRNIAIKFSEVSEEVAASFEDEIPPSTEWTSVAVTECVKRIVARTSGRLLFGLPLCRDPVLRNLSVDFPFDLVKMVLALEITPALLRPAVARFFPAVRRHFKTAAKFFGPLIQDRLDAEKKYGSEWESRPNDVISWLIDHAPPDRKNVDDISRRILMLLFGSVHTTSFTFTWTVYHLAAYSQYIQPLREEIESVIEEEGWTKASMNKMHKLDSFLKETLRITGLAGTSMNRLTLTDFTFSNGTTVPKGTLLSLPSYAIQHDETIYDDPHSFKPFRFADMKESSSGDAHKHHMVTPSSSFLLFGHGRHMCPGRFFAVNELKALIAHVLIHYDIKLEGDREEVPPPKWLGQLIFIDESVKVLFRARAR